MVFSEIYGQERPKAILKNAMANGRLAQSYLFYGPSGVGKEMTAFALAAAVNCGEGGTEPCGTCPACRKIAKLQHPDLQYIFPVPSTLKPQELQDLLKEKGENPRLRISFDKRAGISIDTIRKLKEEASYRVYEGDSKVFIIRDAHTMTTPAANALLKLLEEPPDKLLLILTSSQPQSLLPTILSRCQQIRFELLPDTVMEQVLRETYEYGEEEARMLSRLSAGSLQFVFDLMEEDVEDLRRKVTELFSCTLDDDDLALFKLVEETGGGRNVPLMVKVLKMLQGYFRDILLIGSGRAENIINRELASLLERAAESLPVEGAIASIGAIEHSLGLLPRNINLTLLLFDLIQTLRDIRSGERTDA